MTDRVEEPGTERLARQRPPAPAPWQRSGFRPGAVIAVAFIVGLGAWLLIRGGGSSNTTKNSSSASAVSGSGLKSLSASTGSPIFWAGARAGSTYEYTRTASKRVFVRYLPSGAAVGTNTTYLTIGTYPVPNAYAATETVSKGPGGVTVPLQGGLAFYNRHDPLRVYFAYPGTNYQVEVFSPTAGEARSLVTSGQIVPVSGVRPPSSAAPAGASAHAVSPAGISSLAKSVKHPIYWAGAQRKMTYELTETSGGRIYVRYLPAGAKVGSKTAYLTIGTYPVKDAYTVLAGLAANPGSVRVKVPGGAIGFYDKSHPTNIYVAYPGSTVQVEVYDPSAGAAQKLVKSGHLASVG